jgi:hypothetical protein
MGVADTLNVLWVLKRCVWCKKHIRPDDLEHTTDPEGNGEVWFQHRQCPDVDPLAEPD